MTVPTPVRGLLMLVRPASARRNIRAHWIGWVSIRDVETAGEMQENIRAQLATQSDYTIPRYFPRRQLELVCRFDPGTRRSSPDAKHHILPRANL